MHLLNTSLSKILALTAIILAGLVANYLVAWTGPTLNPPDENTPAPINAGSVSQTKTGDLTVDGNFVVNAAASVDGLTSYSSENRFINGDTTLLVKPGYRFSVANSNYTTLNMADNGSPQYLFVGDNLEVQNTVRANQYCDRDGGNCTNAADLGGGGGGGGFEYVSVIADDVKNIGYSQLPWGSTPRNPSSVSVKNYKFCALSQKAERNDTFGWDTTYRGTACNINRSGTKWTLKANVLVDQAGVRCKMTCFR